MMKAVVQGQWVSLEQKQAVRTAHRSHAETISRWRVASQGCVLEYPGIKLHNTPQCHLTPMLLRLIDSGGAELWESCT